MVAVFSEVLLGQPFLVECQERSPFFADRTGVQAELAQLNFVKLFASEALFAE